MAPQSKPSKRAGDEINEFKPKKSRVTQGRKTTATNGKGGKQSKPAIKQTDSRLSSEDEVEVIEPPKFMVKKMIKVEHCFPRFNNGDVYITLSENRKYNYQLHGSVLIRASTWFEKSLNGSRPVELDEALARSMTKVTRVQARYELRPTDNLNVGYLVRVPLSTTKNPEILPTPEKTPPPSSTRDTRLTSQPSIPSIRQAIRPTVALCQFDGHESGTDDFYEDRSTIILKGPQKNIKAENEEVTTNSKLTVHMTKSPAEPVGKKEVAMVVAVAAIEAQDVDAKTALKEECIKEEDLQSADIKEEYVKNEDIKEEKIKEEEVKEEEIKVEKVMSEHVNDEDVKEEDVKEEDVEDEELKLGNVKKDNIKSAAAIFERQVDSTTTPANIVRNEEARKDIATGYEQQAGANNTRNEPAVKEEEEAAHTLLSFSVFNEEPVLPVLTTQATMKHETSETAVAIQLYEEVQSESSRPFLEEKLIEGEHGLGPVRTRVDEKTKTWSEMLRQAKINKKNMLAKLKPSDDEVALAERVVREATPPNVLEDAAHLKSKAQADTESARPLKKKKEKAIMEGGLQDAAISIHEKGCIQTESNIQEVEMPDAATNEELNEVASRHEVIDLTYTKSAADQDGKIDDMHPEAQTEVAEHSEPQRQPKIEPGELHAEMEGVIDENLVADQKFSQNDHTLTFDVPLSSLEPGMNVTRAEEASEMKIASKRKTETKAKATELAQMIMKEVGPKETKFSSPTTPKSTGPSEDLLEAHNNLFLIYYSQSPVIDASNIEIALKQAELLVKIAGIYGSLPIIRHHVNSCLLSFHRELYEAIARDPPRWVKLSILIKSTPIFKEGIIHIVGTFPSWPSTTTQPEELGIKTNTLIEHKIGALDALKMGIDRTLFLTSIRVDGKEVYLDKDNPSTLSTWFVVQVWRDWYTRSLSEAIHRGDQKQNAIATIYRAIARAGEAYLPLSYVVGLWEAFLRSKQSTNKATIEEIAEDLTLMKSFAQQAVKPICVNNSILNVEEAGIGYFTCAKVEYDHELPWLEALALDDSMTT